MFDIDIDSFEEKPWRCPGVDTSDYFNFGLDEDNWKDYCKQLASDTTKNSCDEKKIYALLDLLVSISNFVLCRANFVWRLRCKVKSVFMKVGDLSR